MKTCIGIIAAALLFTAVAGVNSQTRKVSILKIEVDSKVVNSNFEVSIHKDGQTIIPIREGRSFEVPVNLGESPVSVEIKFNRFDLIFSPIYPSKFQTDWIIG